MISISRMGVVDVSQLAKVTVSARASFGRLKLLIEVVLDLPLQIFLSQRQMMLRMMLMVCSLHDSDIRGGAWLHERLVPTMIWCIDLDMWVCFKHSLVNLANFATVLRQLALASGGQRLMWCVLRS